MSERGPLPIESKIKDALAASINADNQSFQDSFDGGIIDPVVATRVQVLEQLQQQLENGEIDAATADAIFQNLR